VASIAGNIGLPYKTADQKAKANDVARNMSAGQFTDYWRTRWSGGSTADAQAPASRPQPPETEQDAINAALAVLPRTADADMKEATIRNVSMLWSIKERSDKDVEDKGYNAAIGWLERNNGRYDAMPVGIKHAVKEEKWGQLRSYADTVATGVDVQTDPQTFQDMTDPNVLKAMTDQQFAAQRTKLSKGHWEQFARERGNLLNPKPTAGNSPQDLNREAFNDSLKLGLQGLGIVTSQSDKGFDPNKVGQLTKFAQDAVYRAQQEAGHKFSDAETTAYVNQLFNTSIPFRRQLFGVEFGKENAGSMLSVEVKDIPSSEYQSTVQALRSRGVAKPTDDQILSAWRLGHAP
jgi:soluble lytic murein transglycosylase